MIRKIKYILVFLLVLVSALVMGCKNDPAKEDVKANKINLSGKEAMVVGEEQQLSFEVLPSEAKNKEVSFSVSNSRYASVTDSGLVKALQAGSVTIYCELANDSSVYAELAITITKDESVKVTNIIINGRTTMAIGSTQELEVDVYPANATNKTLSWSSSDSSVATVNNGVVNALKAGEVTLKAQANDNSGVEKSFNIKVVSGIDAIDADVEDFKNDMTIGEEQKINLVLVPADATSSYTFSSSNESIATVTKDGVIKAISLGEVEINIVVDTPYDVSLTLFIYVTEELLSVNEIKNLINSTYEGYKQTNIGSSKMTITNDEKVSTLLYKFSFSDDFKTINNVEYLITGDVNNSLYVKDGIIYIDEAGNKGKYALESSEVSAFVKSYNFDKFFNSGLVYKSDNSFYNNLFLSGYEDYTDKNNCTYFYELDLRNYDGTILNLINKDKVELKVVIESGKLVNIEYKATEGEVVKSIAVEFLGFSCDINYPTDLDSYPDVE